MALPHIAYFAGGHIFAVRRLAWTDRVGDGGLDTFQQIGRHDGESFPRRVGLAAIENALLVCDPIIAINLYS